MGKVRGSANTSLDTSAIPLSLLCTMYSSFRSLRFSHEVGIDLHEECSQARSAQGWEMRPLLVPSSAKSQTLIHESCGKFRFMKCVGCQRKMGKEQRSATNKSSSNCHFLLVIFLTIFAITFAVPNIRRVVFDHSRLPLTFRF